jgi:hypothetical protein
MGCNCKRRTQVLNYEDSKDHINLIQSTIGEMDSENLTDLDKIELMSVFKSIYPNAKIEPEPSNILTTLEGVLTKYYSKKR